MNAKQAFTDYIDAWLSLMRDKGHNRAYIGLHEAKYQNGQLFLIISWESDPTELVMPGVETRKSHENWTDGINSFLAIEDRRPDFVVQIPIIGQILGEIKEWPEPDRMFIDDIKKN